MPTPIRGMEVPSLSLMVGTAGMVMALLNRVRDEQYGLEGAVEPRNK